MFENMKESQKARLAEIEHSTPEQIYEEAESKYGPGFAQYCVDILIPKQTIEKAGLPKNHQINNFIKLTKQLHTLSDVCNADHFHEWSLEDKHSYIALLKTVTEDVSHALQRSLMDLKASNDHEDSQNSGVFEVTVNE